MDGDFYTTEQGESTMREALDRERADKAEERAERLEAELVEARKGFWARLFGGSDVRQ